MKNVVITVILVVHLKRIINEVIESKTVTLILNNGYIYVSLCVKLSERSLFSTHPYSSVIKTR
jgi:hypothetical protein